MLPELHCATNARDVGELALRGKRLKSTGSIADREKFGLLESDWCHLECGDAM